MNISQAINDYNSYKILEKSKNNFKIIYKDQEYELTEYFEDIYNIDLFAMWTIYFINSIYGYVIWKKAIVKEENIVAGDERK